MIAYCDLIANIIKNALKINKFTTSKLSYDLHPDHGYLLSTKKTLIVEDNNGKLYKITIEEQ